MTREPTLRLRFRRQGRARFSSHLDLVRQFASAFRRAGFPVAFSHGKQPRPRVVLPYPIPVGVRADAEVIEATFSMPLRQQGIVGRLNRQLPDGLEVTGIRPVRPGEKLVLIGMEYAIGGPWRPATGAIERFLAATSVPVRRVRADRTTEIDIRPLVETIRDEGDRLVLVLGAERGRTTRPDEVLSALGATATDVAALDVTRIAVRERPIAPATGRAAGRPRKHSLTRGRGNRETPGRRRRPTHGEKKEDDRLPGGTAQRRGRRRGDPYARAQE